MDVRPVYTQIPETQEQDNIVYSLLQEEVAEGVEEFLDKRDKELVQWVSLLAGGLLVIASPLFLIELKKLERFWPFVLGMAGFFTILLSLFLGITFYLTNIQASRDNPHYYFLKGKGKGKTAKIRFDIRLAEGRTAQEKPGVIKSEYDHRYLRHVRWVKVSEVVLVLHKISFGVGLVLLIISMTVLVLQY